MKIITLIYQSLRPFLGLTTCIYPLSCGRYALEALEKKPLWQSVPAIVLRVLSCNPITGLIRHLQFRRDLRALEQTELRQRNDEQER
jgi:putative component of membrane protein insertase Oxa1/YidC/SpoIIIJ protein YidD